MAAAAPPARLGYLEYLDALQSYCGPLPPCDVVYKDVTYVVDQNAGHGGGGDDGGAAGGAGGLPSVPGFFLGAALAVPKAAVSVARALVDRAKGAAAAPPPPKPQLRVLDGVTGRLLPGSATLLLAPPGAGKSAFLKILSQRLPSTVGVSGSVSFGGLPMMGGDSSGGGAHAHHHVERPHVPRLVSLCPQADEHFPGLTVRETLSFAVGTQAVPPVPVVDGGGGKAYAPPPTPPDASTAAQVDRLMSLLHLEECADTIIGNESERGISGGQRKRVTIAEALAGLTHRVLLLDEFSTGLDAAVTLELTGALRQWARRCNGTLLAAMLQPTPETYALFDDVLLLMEGRVVYHGPRGELPGYLRGLGFALPPTADDAAGGSAGHGDHGHGSSHGGHGHGHHGHDFADWLTELLTHPARTHEATLRLLQAQQHEDKAAAPTPSPPLTAAAPTPSPPLTAAAPTPSLPLTAAAPTPSLPLTAAALADTWRAHPLSARLMEGATTTATTSDASFALATTPSALASTPFARRAYGRSHARSTPAQLALLAGRQWRLTRRDSPVIFAKSLGGLVMGIVLGTLFWQSGTALNLKLGCILFSLIHIAFGEGISVPIIINQRGTATKQLAAGLYTPFSYVLASVAGGALPISVLETVIFSSALYWMAGFAPQWYRFLFWVLAMLVTALGEGQYFRAVALAAPRAEMGNVLTNPVVGLQVIFGGYLIAESLIPKWLIEFFWLSPISWMLRALAVNEVGDPAYDVVLPGVGNLGAFYMATYDIRPETYWMWAGVLFMLAYFAAATAASVAILTYIRYDRSIGTSRSQVADAAGDDDDAGGGEVAATPAEAAATSAAAAAVVGAPAEAVAATSAAAAPAAGGAVSSENVAVAVTKPLPSPSPSSTGAGAGGAWVSSTLPFSPMTLAFRGITYDVTLPKKDAATGSRVRRLLHGVSGWAEPGSLTLLMGVSGAGKTTLLDVLAGRKSAGVIGGTVTLNGHPCSKTTFARLTAFVEQQDVHQALATVRESLLFSAKLRLPASVSRAQREAFVDEALAVLELSDIAHRLVGIPNSDGLSPSQLKRLSIGVELCANAPILFLDEPTSGLDSRAAEVVMRVVRRIADTNRTVVSTIHQPSQRVFLLADRMLLLQKGGREAYVGPIGPRGADVVAFLEGAVAAANPAAPADALAAARCPPGTNAASWMLEALALGTRLAPPTAKAAAGTAAAEDPETGGGVAAVVADAAAAAPETDPSLPPGLGYVDFPAHYAASPLCASNAARLDALSSPPPGSQPVRLTSPYARSFPVQLLALLQRTWLAYYRNVPYNATRIIVLTVLEIIFGAVYFNSQPTSVVGVTATIAAIFLSVSFCSIISFGVPLPLLERERPMVYRERTSRLYDTVAYSLAMALVEAPWTALSATVPAAMLYGMVGLRPDAGTFFLFLLVHWQLALNFVFVGQWFAFGFPSVQVAQATGGLVVSLFFLFAGAFNPGPSIPAGWRWLYVADPIRYGLEALVAPQFVGTTTQILGLLNGVPQSVNVYTYLLEVYGLDAGQRFVDVGVLFVFMAASCAMAAMSLRYLNWVKR